MGFSKSNCRTAGGRKLRPLCLFAGLFALNILGISSNALALTPVYKISYLNVDQLIWHIFGQTIAFFLVSFCLGRTVIFQNWNVNYTRKILQAILFFTPLFLALYHSPYYIEPFGISALGSIMNSGSDVLILSKQNVLETLNPTERQYTFAQGYLASVLATITITGAIVFLWTIAFSSFVTKKIKFFATAFAAIDRPEDRPRTLLWLRTEIIATYLAILGFLFFSNTFNDNIKNTLFAVIFISSIGDALSGIIGYRYGKRHYKVKALFTQQEYTRTLEGSLCLFLSSVVGISLVFFPVYPEALGRYLALLAVVPAVMTLAEAKSPHSWDNPLIVLSGLLSISLVLFFFP